MKVLLVICAIVWLSVGQAMPQGTVVINGTVTEINSSLPVPDHPVTILSDSSNGIFYYQVVYTDSVGYYRDEISLMTDSSMTFFVQTFDCQDYLHQQIVVTNPIQDIYTRDFQVCVLLSDCQAYFTYYLIDNFSVQFNDNSLGGPSSWYWDFGDGSVSFDQNPVHIYANEGTYPVSLTISRQDSSCFDSFTASVTIIDSTGGGCHAQYSYYPDPQGSPDSFQFLDQSTGNIIYWSWSFGDGTGSNEQNPYHQFPGPGNYEVCLTAGNNACSDTFCSGIVISDTVYHQLYGQVFAGNFPLQAGTVQLFALSPSGGYYQYGDGFNVDSNGVYYFTLVPDGIYLILAVPFDSTGFVPTYYGDVIHWQEATQINLGEPANPYNIDLVQIPLNSLVTGPCSVSGHISGGDAGPDFIRNINMLLMNSEGSAIAFSRVGSSGNYSFPSIDFGTYFVRAELAGVSSYNIRVTLTQEQPDQVVNLNYSDYSILGINDSDPPGYQVDIFPNPVYEELNIHIKLQVPEQITTAIYSLTGQMVYQTATSAGFGDNVIINVKDFPPGIYTVRMNSPRGISIVRKIVKF